MKTQVILTFDVSQEFIQEAFNKAKKNDDNIIVDEVEEAIGELLSDVTRKLLQDEFLDKDGPKLISVEPVYIDDDTDGEIDDDYSRGI